MCVYYNTVQQVPIREIERDRVRGEGRGGEGRGGRGGEGRGGRDRVRGEGRGGREGRGQPLLATTGRALVP